MRLFTAIELDRETLMEVNALAEKVQRRVQEQAPRARITWVSADRMHLTVRFIGEVDAALGTRVIAAFRAPLDVAPFALRLGSVGVFPPRGAPRVIWLGVSEGSEHAVRVEGAVSDRLATLGVPRETRRYTPHLTLGRVREAAGLRGSATDMGEPRFQRSTVEAITLFRSTLSPKGPTYTVLEKTPLQASRR